MTYVTGRLGKAFWAVLAVALIDGSVQAACGGGGYKVVRSNSETKSDGRVISSTISSAPLYDQAHMDKIAAKLNLTAAQKGDVDKLAAEVRKKAGDLMPAYDAAATAWHHCSGNCTNEAKKLFDAKDKLDALNTDFEQRVAKILSADQMATLRSAS
jgi:hypothetical protein